MPELQESLQKNRKQQGLSQVELAKRAGVTQAMVSKLESGKDVRLSTLEAVSKVLGLSVVAVTGEQAFQLRRMLSSHEKSQSLLEQFQVSDDE